MKSERDFGEARRQMVQNQLEKRGIRDPRVLAAMLKIPRHVFVPEELVYEAYTDRPLPIGEGQTISQPYMVALMTELLELDGSEKVLEIGTGSGYQLAILAELSRLVFSVERHATLAEKARRIVRGLGYQNFQVRVGDGTLGWPEEAPFNAIIVTAGAPEVPPPLIEQLDEGGRMVIPVGGEFHQDLLRLIKREGEVVEENKSSCVFVPLIGRYGWKQRGV